MDLKEENILGSAIYHHWYYVSKGKALSHFLGDLRIPEVLDVGAGSGIFSRQLLDVSVCQSALCIDPFYEDERAESHNGKPIAFVRQVDQVTQKLILMMDVLEHVDDDVELLRQYADPMSEDSHILITVPAFQMLWSGHDVFLEHRRRYTTYMLKDTIKKSGLKVEKMRFFFGILFPAALTIRLAKNISRKQGLMEAQSELSIYPEWLNSLLISIHNVELKTVFRINKLVGVSIFCLCRKS